MAGSKEDRVPILQSRWSEHGQRHNKKCCFSSLSFGVRGAETVTWSKSDWERGFPQGSPCCWLEGKKEMEGGELLLTLVIASQMLQTER